MVVSYLAGRVRWLYDFYLWTLTRRDRRVDGWWLMDSWGPTLVLALVYLTAVRLGPGLMHHRRPLQLRPLLVGYNTLIALLNLYIAYELSCVVFGERYSWLCQPVDYSRSPSGLRMATALWLYYLSKLFEFCDTLFFIVRKKQRQLTFLHVYHHSTMFVVWWIGVRWVPGGSSAVGALVNSMVHVIMYSYYGLAAIGPHMAARLAWKRYLTLLQMAQFVLCFCLGLNALRLDCPFPLWMLYANQLYMVSFIVLFSHFYLVTYKKRSSVYNSNGVAHLNGCSTNGTSSSNGSTCNGHSATDKKLS